MLGAIIGDTVGSVYEFNNTKSVDFPFFSKFSNYTDDSVMTFAVAKWLLEDSGHTHQKLEDIMVKVANTFPCPMGGYGGGFHTWLFYPQSLYDYDEEFGEIAYQSNTGRHPYKSWGNGSAMRVSAVGWLFDTLEETERVAKISAEITHNHPEGIKGAQATAAAIWMGRNGKSKDEIRDYIEKKYGYDLHKTWEYWHPIYQWDSSCQGTVPQAIISFLDSNSYENAIRRAVSLGGDSDTLACITGGIAEAFYKDIPKEIAYHAVSLLPKELKAILEQFYEQVGYPKYINKKTKHIAPDFIDTLAENEIFVFGSNLAGMHIGGAARMAMDKFGAVWGQGVGLQGQSYAIPTLQGEVETIKPYVDEFIEFAKAHPEYKFLVTRIGCGIAGFTDAEIASLFLEAQDIENVWLPESFCTL